MMTRHSKRKRVVRVFVSSTFQDMHAEREELVKFVFPELRKRCMERGVEFAEVDLRWGITDEQKSEGKVLPICLAEIESCRPYFIGLLGERYGWVPEEVEEELAKEQPWLLEHKGHSVTELEIFHGVLRNPGMRNLAFFYFRDPDASRKVEENLSKGYEYQPESAASLLKLKSIKERIRKSGCQLKENFPDAKALGQMVLNDLWDVIDKRFPKEEMPTALEREQMEHEAYALSRTKVCIGRHEYFKRLDEHAAGEGLPLVILGESGSGKSALIANWIDRYKEKYPEEFIITHFIGSTADSADYINILRRIMGEIKERYETPSTQPSPQWGEGERMRGVGEGAIPTDPKKIVEAFPLWLAKASAKGRFILVLDALNQLEDRDNAPDLGWLPEYFPPGIRVILSTLPGRSLEVIKKRNIQILEIQPTNREERKQFIKEYLGQYRKALNKAQTERIAFAELLICKGDYKGAEALLMKALAIKEKILAPEHFDTATSLDALATALMHNGDLEAAEPLYRRALAIREKVFGPEHPLTAISLNNLAFLFYIDLDLNNSKDEKYEAAAIREKVLRPEHPDTATILNSITIKPLPGYKVSFHYDFAHAKILRTTTTDPLYREGNYECAE